MESKEDENDSMNKNDADINEWTKVQNPCYRDVTLNAYTSALATEMLL